LVKSLNQYRWLRTRVVGLRKRVLQLSSGVLLDPTATVSLTSRFVSRRRGSIRVGGETLVAFKTLLLSFDCVTGEDRNIVIGRRCFIGGGSLLLPGVTIGDGSIVAAGSVVAGDVPPRCIVAGNPARVIKREIEVGPYGRLAGADERSLAQWR
jgi:maltose O-acetyltransferase